MAQETSKRYHKPSQASIQTNSAYAYGDTDPTVYNEFKIDSEAVKDAGEKGGWEAAGDGAAIGAGLGGTIGTAVEPGIGTAVGAVVGTAIGAGIGYSQGGIKASEEEYKRQIREYEAEVRKKKLAEQAAFDKRALAQGTDTTSTTSTDPSVESMGTPTMSAGDAWRKQVYG